MKENRPAAGWSPVEKWVTAALIAIAAVLLAVGLHCFPAAQAATYTVTEVDGVYVVNGDTEVVPVVLYADEGWTVANVTVDGNVYQDAEGRYYTVLNTDNFVISITAQGWYYLPRAGDADVEFLTAASYRDGVTTLTYTNPRREWNSCYVTPPTLMALDEIDEKGVVVTTEGYYYRTADGLTFAEMVHVRIENPTIDDFLNDQLYDQGNVDGIFMGHAIPGQISMTLNENYLFTGEMPTIDYYSEGEYAPEFTVSFPDERTIAVDCNDWSGITEITIRDLQVQVSPDAKVNLTFAESEYFSVYVNDTKTTSLTWGLGQDLPFWLDTGPKYSVSSWSEAITDCILSSEKWGNYYLYVSDVFPDDTGEGSIYGSVLDDDYTIIIEVDPAAFTPLVYVADTSGAGYTLTCTGGATPGTTEPIQLLLTVDAGYSQSVPTVTPPEGWVINEGDMSSENAPDGSVLWYITMVYGDGAVPAAPNELTVAVSGITANPGSGGGGGGGGDDTEPVPTKPAIRVENELDEENASSDTSLWPYGTVEEDGVSTTTVTDEELEALLELARQHAEDIEQLPGDGYKEGIIVIEDLGEGSANHTYILELTDPQFQRISDEEWDRFTVQTPAGSLSLYGQTIRETASQEGAVSFTIARLEHEGRPGVDVTLEVDHKAVTEFSETYGLRIFIPYVPAEGEDVNAITVEYIHEDGTVELVTECYYDAAAGGVYFFTNHLSKFGVVYRPAVFTDVGADHWASPYVTFLAARGLVGDSVTYRPDDKATRGELIELVAKALSAANLPNRAVQVYSDVPTSASVAQASNWVYYNNLAGSFTSGGQLRPNEAITREDMAALLGNVASGVGLRLRSKGLDTGYTDLNEIASYARQAVTRLRAAGILEMAENYKFNPDATLNRGEMAQIVAALLSNL